MDIFQGPTGAFDDINAVNIKDIFKEAEARFYRGDFNVAYEKFQWLEQKVFYATHPDMFLQIQMHMLRIACEQERKEDIQRIEKKIYAVLDKQQEGAFSNPEKPTEEVFTRSQGGQCPPRVYYILGFCRQFAGEFDKAFELYEKSLTLSLEINDKEQLSYAICGLSSIYWERSQCDKALQEIANLEILFQVLQNDHIKAMGSMLKAQILRRVGNYEEAGEILWSVLESVKETKNHYTNVVVFYSLGLLHLEKGENEKAEDYLKLAKTLANAKEYVVLYKNILSALSSIGTSESHKNYDLFLKMSEKTVYEKEKGVVSFNNQFILMDLLRLLISSPGVSFSKEDLIEKVWGQEYNPEAHDNKVYVTVKRLKKMLEPNYYKPKYIFRSKEGYYFNKNVKTFVEPC